MKTLAFLTLLGTCAAPAAVIVSENFGGLAGDTLGTTSADIFLATGGSASPTWIADSGFKANGSVTSTSGTSARAYLDLGSHINDTKGTSSGFFTFQATLARSTGSTTSEWISFGTFHTAPVSGENFTVNGLFTSLLRSTDSSNSDYYTGGATGVGGGFNAGVISGNTTYTMTLDLRPASGYNGTTNQGIVSFFRNGSSTAEHTFTYTSSQNYQYVGFTINGNNSSSLSNFTITQIIPEPSALLLGALGLLPLLRRKR